LFIELSVIPDDDPGTLLGQKQGFRIRNNARIKSMQDMAREAEEEEVEEGEVEAEEEVEEEE
jgi:hypothetical protein